MSAPDRLSRVNEILKREIADLIEKYGIQESNCLVSVTSVKTSSDLRKALVNISVLGGGKETEKAVLKSLNQFRRELQSQIGKDITLKYTPVLKFVIDDNLKEGDRVLSLLEELTDDEEQV